MKNNEFARYKIKAYTHWILYLHEEQYPYLGRCYAAAKRDTAEKTTDMNADEREELFTVVLPAWDKAISSLFDYDWPNISSLGNTWHHLHWHFIPRYHKDIEYNEIVFHDPKPDYNYSPHEKKHLDEPVLQEIKQLIADRL